LCDCRDPQYLSPGIVSKRKVRPDPRVLSDRDCSLERR